jgi:DNA-binding MarR family transcriptional regulator
MATASEQKPLQCNCAAIRHAARRVTQHYDQHLAGAGLRSTQFSILAKLKRIGPLTINGLAAEMGMDRSTLGRNILPLERDGLISINPGSTDLRSKELQLTRAGIVRFRAGLKCWSAAQQGFEAAFGAQRAAALRALLGDVVASDLAGAGKELVEAD